MIDISLDTRMIRHSGIGTYLRGLLGEFQSHPFFEEKSLELAIPAGPPPEMGRFAHQTFLFRSPIYSVWEQLEYPFHLRRARIWHAPHYNVPLIKGKTRLVVTLHDVIHWIFRKDFYAPLQAFYAGSFLKRAVRSASRIIAVSEKTREDLIYHFNAPPEKIKVIYEGVDERFYQPLSLDRKKEFLIKNRLPDSFFLYVGLIKPHKNVARLVRVYQKLRKEGRLGWGLVLVGRKDRDYLPLLETGGGIHYIDEVRTSEELQILYASAGTLVHPSLYEGFGLTVLEAMASGTPVIASRAGALPEVTGTAARFVDPQSDDSLAEALQEMESNESLRHRLSTEGLRQARKFGWRKAAEETVQVYREVLDRG